METLKEKEQQELFLTLSKNEVNFIKNNFKNDDEEYLLNLKLYKKRRNHNILILIFLTLSLFIISFYLGDFFIFNYCNKDLLDGFKEIDWIRTLLDFILFLFLFLFYLHIFKIPIKFFFKKTKEILLNQNK